MSALPKPPSTAPRATPQAFPQSFAPPISRQPEPPAHRRRRVAAGALWASIVVTPGCALMDYSQPAAGDPKSAELTLAWPGPVPPELAAGNLSFLFVTLGEDCRTERSFYRGRYSGASGWARASDNAAALGSPTPGIVMDPFPKRTVRIHTDRPLRISAEFDLRRETRAGYNQRLISSRICRSAVQFQPEPGARYEATYDYAGSICGWRIVQRDAADRPVRLAEAARPQPICRPQPTK